MAIKLAVGDTNFTQLKPRITVIGVGGGGGNAISNMMSKKLEGVDFVVANTDAQALALSPASRKIQLGLQITQGLGAGARPEIGKLAAEEAKDDIEREISDSNMVFITAGMGGGTGSGAAPVVAKIAKEKGILTVGVVTKPFAFEGKKRMENAENALETFIDEVDSIIVIPNQNLFRIADKNTTLKDAFVKADEVLYDGVRSITDLMIMPGLINLDFADVKKIMADRGKAIMGTGEAEGEDRARVAAEQALSNPILDDCSLKGAKGCLINFTGGYDITLMEIDEAVNIIKEELDDNAELIFGSSYDDSLSGRIRVSVVVTGIDDEAFSQPKS
ncbi:MAG: cell division protein FtsZ, partial [Alphaproteobacteria bacterium]|nr:cell division protein FtsZ [Alphaproteobacteria bacterium]